MTWSGAPISGEAPEGALLTLLNAPLYGYAPILVFGWRGETSPNLRLPENAENSWANEEAADLYVSVVTEIATDFEPPFLFLGNESDLYFDQNPEDYARWVAVYDRAYDAVKAASPETLVGPIVQYERTAGIGALAGQTEESWGALTAHDFDRVDLPGLTVYPFFAHATPEEIPLVNCLFLHSPTEPAPGGLNPLEWNLFHSLSLRRSSGEKRPVYPAWEAFTVTAP